MSEGQDRKVVSEVAIVVVEVERDVEGGRTYKVGKLK